MEDYQERVLVEQEELSKKIVSLTTFVTDFDKIKSLTIPVKEFDLMLSQLDTMLDYQRILQMRLLIFTGAA